MAAGSNKIFSELLFKQYKYSTRLSPVIIRILRRDFSKNVTRNASLKSSVSIKKFNPKNKLGNDCVQPAWLPAFDSKQFGTHGPKNTSGLLNIKCRPFSTLTSHTRFYSSKKWGNKTEEEKCETKRECYKPCPKWQLGNCPPLGNNPDCLHPYVDPCCKKKMAPYPSYSETCAERLEDDPSECMQCPWSRCGGSESLKYPKRRYHTASSAACHRFRMTSLPVLNITETLVPVRCDAKKPACKRPPGKCDKVQKKEPCPEKKGPCPPPFDKKKCDKEPQQAMSKWAIAYRIWADKNTVVVPVTEESVVPLEMAPGDEDDCKGDMITPDNSCCLKLPFDKKQMDYEQIKKKQCHLPNCKRKKRKMVPDGCDGTCNKKCDSSNLFDVRYDCQKKKKRCPRGDCNRPKCPDTEMKIDRRFKPIDPCCERAIKEMYKGRKPKPKTNIPDDPNHDGLEKSGPDL